MEDENCRDIHPVKEATNIRDATNKYFNSPACEVPWQQDYINLVRNQAINQQHPDNRSEEQHSEAEEHVSVIKKNNIVTRKFRIMILNFNS